MVIEWFMRYVHLKGTNCFHLLNRTPVVKLHPLILTSGTCCRRAAFTDRDSHLFSGYSIDNPMELGHRPETQHPSTSIYHDSVINSWMINKHFAICTAMHQLFCFGCVQFARAMGLQLKAVDGFSVDVLWSFWYLLQDHSQVGYSSSASSAHMQRSALNRETWDLKLSNGLRQRWREMLQCGSPET